MSDEDIDYDDNAYRKKFSWLRVSIYLLILFTLILVYIPQSRTILTGLVPNRHDVLMSKNSRYKKLRAAYEAEIAPLIGRELANCRETISRMDLASYTDQFAPQRIYGPKNPGPAEEGDPRCAMLSCQSSVECTLGYTHSKGCKKMITPVNQAFVYRMHRYAPKSQASCVLPNMLRPPTSKGRLSCLKGRCRANDSRLVPEDFCQFKDQMSSMRRGCLSGQVDLCLDWVRKHHPTSLDSSPAQTKLCSLGKKEYCLNPKSKKERNMIARIRSQCLLEDQKACVALGIWLWPSDSKASSRILSQVCQRDKVHCRRVMEFYQQVLAEDRTLAHLTSNCRDNARLDHYGQETCKRLDPNYQKSIEGKINMLKSCEPLDSKAGQIYNQWHEKIKEIYHDVYY